MPEVDVTIRWAEILKTVVNQPLPGIAMVLRLAFSGGIQDFLRAN